MEENRMEKLEEKIGWNAKWRIDKFRDPDDKIAKALQAGMPMNEALSLYAKAFICTERIEGNIALNEGLQALIGLACAIGSETAGGNAAADFGGVDCAGAGE